MRVINDMRYINRQGIEVTPKPEKQSLKEKISDIGLLAEDVFESAPEFLRGAIPGYGTYANAQGAHSSLRMGMTGRSLLSLAGAVANGAGIMALATGGVPVALGLFAVAGATNALNYSG